MSEAVPRLRFPEFDGEWSGERIGILLESIPTKRHQIFASEFQNSGELPVIDQGELKIAGYTDCREKMFSDVPVIVFGDHTTILKHVDFPFVVGADGTKILKPKQGSTEFFYYAIQSNPVEQEGYKRHFSILSEKSICFPDLEEQRRIASVLSAVDYKIDTLRKKKDALSRFKTGFMQKIFSQEIRFTREDGSAFPDWVETTLDEIFDFHPTNSLSRADLKSDEANYLNIHYGDIHTRLPSALDLVECPLPFIREEKTAIAERQRPVNVGDVVIADASEDLSDVGKAVEIVRISDTPAVAGLHTIHASPKPGRELVCGFAAHLFRSPPVRRGIQRQAHGTKVVGISPTRLATVSVGLPHPAEQRKIADVLSALDGKITAVDDQINRIESFKNGLLQQMFV